MFDETGGSQGDGGGETGGSSQQTSEFKQIEGLLEANSPDAANKARKWLVKLYNAGQLPQEIAEVVKTFMDQQTAAEGIPAKQATISSFLTSYVDLFKQVGESLGLGLSKPKKQEAPQEKVEAVSEVSDEPVMTVENGAGRTCITVEKAIAKAITILAKRMGDQSIRLDVHVDKSGKHVLSNKGEPLLSIDKKTGEIGVHALGSKSQTVASFLSIFSTVRRHPEIVLVSGDATNKEVLYQSLKGEGVKPHHVFNRDPKTKRRDFYNSVEGSAAKQEELEEQRERGVKRKRQ